MIDKLIVFDFDDTFFHTPLPDQGKIEWEEKTGNAWPYEGWWSKKETIDSDFFNIEMNQWTYEKYLDAVSDPNAYIIMATGRLEKIPGMRENVEKLLRNNNIVFDELHLNWGGDTFIFKKDLLEQTIEKLGVKELIFYDDRQQHIPKFIEWANSMPINTKIIDVINKTTTTIDNI